MTELCSNCKKPIESPVEHEFCTYVNSRPEKPPEDVVVEVVEKRYRFVPLIPFGGEPPHQFKKEPIPTQKPLTHDIAPAGSKPPVRLGEYYGYDYSHPLGSYEDVAARIVENKT